MFNKIGNGLDSVINFIEYLKNNSFIKITKYVIQVAFWIMILASAFNYTKIFEWIYTTSNEISTIKHDALTAYRIKIGPEVESILKDLCIEGNGTRSYILEFHNGTNNPAGLPFYYMNMTYEYTDTSKTYSGAASWSELLISRFPLVSKFYNDGIYVGSIEEIMAIDENLAYKLKGDDVKYMGCILLYGKNKPIGILGISTGEEPVTSYADIKSLLMKYSHKIVKLLDVSNVE